MSHSRPAPTRGMLFIGLSWIVACGAPEAGPAPPLPERVPSIVPHPAELRVVGPAVSRPRSVAIVVDPVAESSAPALTAWARAIVAEAWGSAVVPPRTPAPGFVLRLDLDSTAFGGAEGYELTTGGAGIRVAARQPVGLFYGLETLRQILADAGDAMPSLAVRDTPRFAYRGMHLDVGRHLFPVSFIERYIDLLARFKFNRFHWHLTEDQGWRLEIAAYPKLTEISAYRAETMVEKNFDPYVGDGTPYGGFYTQDEVRRIVAYAQERFVTIVPEIEMPGHSVAVLAAYPELACTEGPFEVRTTWGISQDIFCPHEATFAFLETVLREVMDLFPGQYIHIGGDEAPKARWESSPVAQAVMAREGLADEDELQSYFIRRINRFLHEHGRRLIGWDEILEGGLAEGATVMSWRGMTGGIEAAREGHDVIMTPGTHVYFDHYQGDPAFEPLAIGGLSTLERVYHFEPVPEALTAAEARHVIGAQANVWTEYMPTTAQVEYMVAPRILALAEVVWSPRAVRDWEGFRKRLPAQLRALDGMGIGYRVPSVEGLPRDRLTLRDTVVLTLGAPYPGADIRYTVDGTEPGPRAPRYREPVSVAVPPEGVTVQARVYGGGGRPSPLRRVVYRRATLRAATPTPTRLAPGIRYRYREARTRSVQHLDREPVTAAGVADDIVLPSTDRDTSFSYEFEGWLRIPRDDVYTFALTSDDGSDLRIGGTTVIDHDGLHGPSTRVGDAALAAGLHPIAVRYYQAGGGTALALELVLPDGTRRPVTAMLFHEP